jgi:hypothetical protein
MIHNTPPGASAAVKMAPLLGGRRGRGVSGIVSKRQPPLTPHYQGGFDFHQPPALDAAYGFQRKKRESVEKRTQNGANSERKMCRSKLKDGPNPGFSPTRGGWPEHRKGGAKAPPFPAVVRNPG